MGVKRVHSCGTLKRGSSTSSLQPSPICQCAPLPISLSSCGWVFTFAFNVLLRLEGQVEARQGKARRGEVRWGESSRGTFHGKVKFWPKWPSINARKVSTAFALNAVRCVGEAAVEAVAPVPAQVRWSSWKCHDLIYGYLTAHITCTRVGRLVFARVAPRNAYAHTNTHI